MLIYIIIGILTSIIGYFFRVLIFYGKNIILDLSVPFWWFPIIGGVILGTINRWFLTENRGFHLLNLEGEIKYHEEFFTILGGFSSLILGFSVGIQGLLIYTGKLIGKIINMQKKSKNVRLMATAGVAGMVTSFFGMPIFSIVFGCEVILKRFRWKEVLYIALTTILSFVIGNKIFGLEMFLKKFLLIESINMNMLGYTILLGIFLGVVSAGYIKTIFISKNELLNKRPFIVTLTSGILLSIGSLWFIDLYHVHFDIFSQLLTKKYTITFLGLLIVFKIVLTAISLNYGGYGGAFLPGVVIGALSGLLFDQIFQLSTERGFIFLGVIGVFSGFSDAPLTAIVLGLALSGYNMKLAIFIIIVSIISNYVREFIIEEDLY